MMTQYVGILAIGENVNLKKKFPGSKNYIILY